MADDIYLVERSMTVAAPMERVYEQIVDFRRWVAWSPWEGRDPDLQRTYSGAPSGAGAVYGWSGNRKAGRGEMTVTTVNPPSKVEIALRFDKPFAATNEATFTLTPEGSGCAVTWSMTGRKSRLTRVMGLVKSMDALLGPDFEAGLARLKAVSELGVAQ